MSTTFSFPVDFLVDATPEQRRAIETVIKVAVTKVGPVHDRATRNKSWTQEAIALRDANDILMDLYQASKDAADVVRGGDGNLYKVEPVEQGEYIAVARWDEGAGAWRQHYTVEVVDNAVSATKVETKNHLKAAKA